MPRDLREVDRETARLPEDHLVWFMVGIGDSPDPGRQTSAFGHGSTRVQANASRRKATVETVFGVMSFR